MEPLGKGLRIAERYVLTSLLHSGEHCQIWQAQDERLKSQVAMKIASNRDVIGVNLLTNEFTQAARCVHQGVVRAFELHTGQDLTFLTLEYLAGGSMERLAGRPQAQFLPALIQIAEALDHVHQQGVVHRDIKLSNLLFDGRNHARVTDFGIASDAGANGLRSGGSPRCMSPAQRAGEPPEPGDDMYAFGVALYRLAEGRWPDEDGSPMHIGPTLTSIIEQLMHPDPRQRPVSMALVADSLRQALSEQSNATLPPDEFVFDTADDQSIEVVSPSSAPVGTPVPHESAGAPRRKLVPLLVLYGVIGVVVLFYFMPRWAGERNAVVPVTPAVTPTNAQAPAAGPVSATTDIEPWKLAQQAKLRKDAESMLEQLLDKQFYLDDKKASLWAVELFDELKEKAIAGDQLFRQKKYTEALSLYAEGYDLATSLGVRADTIVADTLAEADAALAAGDAATATQKYSLAAEIEGTSQLAQTGLERAANLDEVLALVTSAEALEQQGDSATALATYKQATTLDPEWPAALEGIRRIERQRANNAFAVHMSTGYKALSASEFVNARAAFERARAIRPAAGEVEEALGQLDTAIRLQDVTRLESRAAALEQQGDWRSAEREYQAALSQDASRQSARDGIRRVRNRAAVEEELQELLNEPVRLTSASVYSQAEAVLIRMQPYLGDADMAAQAARLRTLMAQTRQPVTVTLVSDGATEVTVYRVGQMGSFTSRSLDLRPGEYTAVGSRAGYRDVRVSIVIAPGQSATQIEVVCRESI